MDAYIAGALTDSKKESWKIYEDIGKVVEEFGLSAHIPHIHTGSFVGIDYRNTDLPKVDETIAAAVCRKNLEVVENAKIIIAEVSNPSTGTGIEIGHALNLGKKIICLANKNAKITNMIRGAASLGMIDLIRYENEEDALNQLRSVLSNRENYGKTD